MLYADEFAEALDIQTPALSLFFLLQVSLHSAKALPLSERPVVAQPWAQDQLVKPV